MTALDFTAIKLGLFSFYFQESSALLFASCWLLKFCNSSYLKNGVSLLNSQLLFALLSFGFTRTEEALKRLFGRTLFKPLS